MQPNDVALCVAETFSVLDLLVLVRSMPSCPRMRSSQCLEKIDSPQQKADRLMEGLKDCIHQ